jgi:hypothetical protein
MRSPAIVAMAAAAASMALAGWGPAPAAAAMTCTWGGTPDAPTGTFTIRPGVTSTPSTGPLDFSASGPLAGGPPCTGKLTYTGQFDTGSWCNFISWRGRVKGLPGVERFEGAGNLIGPSLLYDENGNVVGSDQALVQALPGDSELLDCNTPEGFTHGHFSAFVEVF